jgi:phenylalanyl-tRNA synthetase beta chain
MIISYQWLLQYLPAPLPVAELAEILTSVGLEVEAIEKVEAVKGSLADLVIGKVLTCEKHPDADRLSVTTVDIGAATPLQIVCGAPNVAAGQQVVVAPVGATVYPLTGEPFLIKKAKIRGVASEGMICAEDEIGLGESHAGIMVLPPDAVTGTLARDYFKIPEPDHAIHIGLTPNRSDAMSHIGVARDVCAWLSHHHGGVNTVRYPAVPLWHERWAPLLQEYKIPVLAPASSGQGTTSVNIRINIDAPEACYRYAGLRISGVRVGPSPEWLQQRLKAVGLRSVNNVVDVTNFVLHEYGQPLHAFDAEKIGGGEIHVRFLPSGTGFVTLDEQERKLHAEDLMICDAERGLCMAGVFGGIGSGVTENTTEVFLESAWFHPKWIRRTSLRHGLRTDAATRFEKGADMQMVIPALLRAAALIVETAGGSVSAVEDVYARAPEPVQVQVRYTYINKLCGKVFDPSVVQNILVSLGFTIAQSDEKGLTVVVPSGKTDVRQPADIVEEILRIDGLDNVPLPERLNISLTPQRPGDHEARERIAGLLAGQGFQEIVTNSIVNSKYYPGREDLVRLLNSLSQELDVMRPAMLESGLEVILYNVNRKNQDLSLFEFGKTYTLDGTGYRETPCLALWITGNAQPAQWNRPAWSSDIFYLKGVVQGLLEAGGIEKVSLEYDDERNQVQWKWKKRVLATVAAVDAAILRQFDIRQEVCHATIDWTLWTEAAAAHRVVYREVPRFPAVRRDLAIVLDKSVKYREVAAVTEQLKLSAMQSFDLFDVFESERLGPGRKSYALSYTFQLQDRTLTDQETDQLMQQLVQAYTSRLNAQIRE